MTSTAVLGKRSTSEVVPETDDTLVTYGNGRTYTVASELLDLLRAAVEELKRGHQKSTGVTPVNHLAKRLIEDKEENASMLLDLAVYARFKLGIHVSALGSWWPELNSSQHAVLTKMAYASKSRFSLS